jgi:hypothetical protein
LRGISDSSKDNVESLVVGKRRSSKRARDDQCSALCSLQSGLQLQQDREEQQGQQGQQMKEGGYRSIACADPKTIIICKVLSDLYVTGRENINAN